jgi:hypothetical protein
MLNLFGLRKGVCFESSTAIYCEILFVTVDFAHWTVAQTQPQRPEIIKNKKLATLANLSHQILCLGHEIN